MFLYLKDKKSCNLALETQKLHARILNNKDSSSASYVNVGSILISDKKKRTFAFHESSLLKMRTGNLITYRIYPSLRGKDSAEFD